MTVDFQIERLRAAPINAECRIDWGEIMWKLDVHDSSADCKNSAKC